VKPVTRENWQISKRRRLVQMSMRRSDGGGGRATVRDLNGYVVVAETVGSDRRDKTNVTSRRSCELL